MTSGGMIMKNYYVKVKVLNNFNSKGMCYQLGKELEKYSRSATVTYNKEPVIDIEVEFHARVDDNVTDEQVAKAFIAQSENYMDVTSVKYIPNWDKK
jgi:hypothetical protein